MLNGIKVSVIVPTKNEQGNIAPFLARIKKVLDLFCREYEIIFIDDNSTDRTLGEIAILSDIYPVRLFSKEGPEGKAQSIIEGVKKATYDLIVMIDADLQYPPEAIANLIEKYEQGADVVVANRKFLQANFLRKLMSRSFRFIFGKFLHGFEVDVQSGLKLFKREVFENITLNPDPWTFDLEFLLKARSAGYQIDSIESNFYKRLHGKSKIKIFQAVKQIAISAVKLKFKEFVYVIPFNLKEQKTKGSGFYYNSKSFIPHTDLTLNESAFLQLTNGQIAFFQLFLLSIVILFLINWHTLISVLVSVLISIYFLDILFNLFLIIKSLKTKPEIKINQIDSKRSDWPFYTILCPLYHEAKVLSQFVKAINKLDYPKDRLQVLLLLEEDDMSTMLEALSCKLPPFIEINVVPNSLPKTKPKACNYGLQRAIGEYIVIFDAEDIPESKQLKKAVMTFESSPKKLICVQAKLNFYNPHQNMLTKLFTAEYALWFDLVLPGLQSLNAPIPLGGTSNHFKATALKSLKGWDSFNVTEDCDLGVRLAKKGFQTAMIDSTTYEEANSQVKNWFLQRTRWIKGYIQTYLVHNRDFMKSWPKHDFKDYFVFQLVVGGKILSMFINPLMWILTAVYFIFRSIYGPLIESFFPTPVLYMGVVALVFGNFLYFYYYMIGCAVRDYYQYAKYGYLVPFYWLFMSLASYVALYKLLTQPHYWPKTVHGFHLKDFSDNNNFVPNIGYS